MLSSVVQPEVGCDDLQLAPDCLHDHSGGLRIT